MEMKIVGVTLAAFVSLVVLAAVLVPILDDARTTEDKFTNNGYFNMSYTESDSVTMAWDHTTPTQITVNSDVIDLPALADIPTYGLTIICGDNWLLRYNSTGLSFYTNATTHTDALIADDIDATLVAASGSATFTTTAQSSNTATVTYTNLYYVIDNGEFVMKISGEDAYVNGDSEIFAMGRTYLASTANSLIFRISGSVDDGITVENAFPTPTVVYSDEVVSITPDASHKDLYKIGNIDFTVTNTASEPPKTGQITYSYYLVPSEVTAERSVHFTDNMNELLGVIPVLVIVAILVGVVALVIRSKLE